MECYICPRNCGADRENGQLGFCGVSNKIYIARAALHFWEEPCISGKEGSGAVFFAGCSLGCIYCQNHSISRGRRKKTDVLSVAEDRYSELKELEMNLPGLEYSIEELADCFLKLQEKKANNINLVTPTHYSLQIIESVKIAKKRGLEIPIVYNCSGYEKVETLRKLEEVIDIYLTDFKYIDSNLSKKYSYAANYGDIAKEALEEMVRQKPVNKFDARGMLTEGVIVRNLLLPGNVRNSKEVIQYVFDKYGDSVYLSIMNQYTPLSHVSRITPLNRKVTKREYNRLLEYVISIGVSNAYIQEGDVASESFIPEFE